MICQFVKVTLELKMMNKIVPKRVMICQWLFGWKVKDCFAGRWLWNWKAVAQGKFPSWTCRFGLIWKLIHLPCFCWVLDQNSYKKFKSDIIISIYSTFQRCGPPCDSCGGEVVKEGLAKVNMIIWSEWWGDMTWPTKRQRQWQRQIHLENTMSTPCDSCGGEVVKVKDLSLIFLGILGTLERWRVRGNSGDSSLPQFVKDNCNIKGGGCVVFAIKDEMAELCSEISPSRYYQLFRELRGAKEMVVSWNL